MHNTIKTGILIFLVSAFAAHAQEETEARTFTRIAVDGNERFSDQDVIVSSGLDLSRPLTRLDLELGVDALDYTGEFETVAIDAQGDVLLITVEEQPEYSGNLTFGVGYDSDSGLIGVAGLTLTDIGSPGTDLNSEVTFAQEFQSGSLEITNDTILGEGYVTGLRLSYDSYDYDNTLFGYDQISISPFVRIAFNDNSDLELRYSYISEELRDVAAGASSILFEEAGARKSSAIGATLRSAGLLDGTQFRWSTELSHDFIGLGTNRSFSRTEGTFTTSTPVAQTGFALRNTVAFGAIRNSDTDGARAIDRFTLGGAQMRGFERGSITVRDANGSVSTSLGGENYAVARTDLILPVFREREGVDTFLFADVGNVWRLENANAADGTVDEDGEWRQSTGAGVSLTTDLGRFEAYFALKVAGTETDIEQALGLTFRVAF